MRLLMMGTGPFAVPTFRSLLDSQHTLTGLVTRPLLSSRGRKKTTNPMLEVAEEIGLPVAMPEDINSPGGQEAIAQFSPDLLVVCDYGQILSAETLQRIPLGGINLHGSLLPRYRGAAPINWAIMRGEQVTGTTVIHMTAQLDGGPLLATSQTEIGKDEDAEQLEQRLAELGVAPVCEAIRLLEQWDGKSSLGAMQPADQVTQARRLRKSDGQLDWSLSAIELHNRVRGLRPWPGTYTFWQRTDQQPMRLILVRTTPYNPVPLPPALCEASQAAPGQVVFSSERELVVATGGGLLALEQIQPAGKRVMQIEEFLRGYPVATGEQLGE